MSFDEFRQSYAVHKMGEQETVNAFDCGDEDLNGFILTDAQLYRKEKLAVTYTVLETAAVAAPVAVTKCKEASSMVSMKARARKKGFLNRGTLVF